MIIRVCLILGVMAAGLGSARAQEAAVADVEERFRRLERIVADQAEQIRRLSDENRELAGRIREGSPKPPPVVDLPALVDEGAGDGAVTGVEAAGTEEETPAVGLAPTFAADWSDDSWRAERGAFSALMDAGDQTIPEPEFAASTRSFFAGGYEKGFVLVAPSDRQRAPFSLKFNLTTQVRYTGFARSVESWTDSSGLVLPVRNRSYFALNRNFLSFTGFAFSPHLRFNTTIFSTSATNQTIAMGWVEYEFAKAFIVGSGYYKVPGTREWIESARYPLGADRTMANTFFRPGISSGVWAQGEPIRNVFYYAGIYDNLSSVVNLTNRTSTNMTYVANAWWEPLGAFGPGYSDEEYHETPAVRLGSSVLYHRGIREPDLEQGQTNPENTIIRLTDGTPLYQVGALAPGVTVEGAHILLGSYDLSLKYRGLSLSTEVYTRWLTGLRADRPAPRGALADMADVGGFAQGSYALIPKRFELFARTSGVFGRHGDGSEYGGGANWYLLGNRNVRATFEAKRINHSPASNVLYGYFAGESGTLFQVQLLTDF